MSTNLDDTVQMSDDSLAAMARLPGRFKMAGILGQGGMGIVLKAVDLNLSREVAVKVLLFEGSKAPEVQARFLREAQVLGRLDHPNIVKVLSSGLTDSGDPYNVMELLTGDSLAAKIEKEGCLSNKDFYSIIKQICNGLSYAHKNRVVHRDLKPSNIMLCPLAGGSVQVKIIDFGIARIEEEEKPDKESTVTLTGTQALMGSPAYMSPEQCKGGGKTVEVPSDIYSLGCIMYECLTGKAPFEADSALQVMYKHMREPAPSLEAQAKSEQAISLGKLIDRCLQKEIPDRPQNIEELVHELDRIFSDTNLDLSFTGRTLIQKEQEKTETRKLAFAFGIAAAVLISLAALGFYAFKTFQLSGISQKYKHREEGKRIKEVLAKDEIKQLQLVCAQIQQRLKSTVDPQARVEMVTRMLEKEAEIVKIYMGRKEYMQAIQTQSEFLSACEELEGVEVDRWKSGILVERSDCKQELGMYEAAQKDLDLSAEILRKFNGCEWNVLRSRVNLNLKLARFDLVVADMKNLPEAWRRDSKYKLWSANLFGTPFCLSDELLQVYDKSRNLTPETDQASRQYAEFLLLLSKALDEEYHRDKARSCVLRAQSILSKSPVANATLIQEAEKLLQELSKSQAGADSCTSKRNVKNKL
ncbi:MAG: serine/threonine protein kinase [Candidatus Obscuribacterales bacterium]|nr:serine/threonine protein kinase [Candidatus Obscuribacterales bacterium]